jgi:hypothetical protein
MKKQIALLIILTALSFNISTNAQNKNKAESKSFTDSFTQNNCQFLTIGKNDYFILEPGYQEILEGKEGKDFTRLVITVLNETKKIGNIETRIVEENESLNGQVIEISRNYFAFCPQTSSIYYFGEDVDIYKNGKIVDHSGAWIAEGNNKSGLVMPGLVLLGARYYQEVAPGIAMDRAEIISINETIETPAGEFTNVLKTEETTPLEPLNKELKLYAPGVGLIKDENLLLVKYGLIK